MRIHIAIIVLGEVVSPGVEGTRMIGSAEPTWRVILVEQP